LPTANAGKAVDSIIAAISAATARTEMMRLIVRYPLSLKGGTRQPRLKLYNEAKYEAVQGLAQLPRIPIVGSPISENRRLAETRLAPVRYRRAAGAILAPTRAAELVAPVVWILVGVSFGHLVTRKDAYMGFLKTRISGNCVAYY
jgi:hypothetical protein